MGLLGPWGTFTLYRSSSTIVVQITYFDPSLSGFLSKASASPWRVSCVFGIISVFTSTPIGFWGVVQDARDVGATADPGFMMANTTNSSSTHFKKR